ncbi:helix-turn-helix domain-containing protein [Streptomyces sp. NPDC002952]|uniref:helix-turn-helix domain-containing protein n=1 Tax=Streptomyces sp. NPDC002952 TaxID=3364673 RepID=UPI0036A23C21
MTRTEVTDEQISAAQAGDEMAMWEIVKAFDPMMTSIIRSAVAQARGEDVEDLLQEARMVLIQRVHDYDSDSSAASLSSFVYREVRRTVQEAHVSMTTPVTISPTVVLRVRRALWAAAGNVEEAWAALAAEPVKDRMSRERFMGALEAMVSTDSFDASVGGEDGDGTSLTLADIVADPRTSLANSVERQDYARWLLTQINARHAYALRAYFGINMTALPDAEAAIYLGCKPGTVRTLRTAGYASARRVSDVQAWLREQAPVASALAA